MIFGIITQIIPNILLFYLKIMFHWQKILEAFLIKSNFIYDYKRILAISNLISGINS